MINTATLGLISILVIALIYIITRANQPPFGYASWKHYNMVYR